MESSLPVLLPFSPSMNCILAISHQKGGVGKTSTALNLSGGLVLQNKRVLLIDLDPQGNASSALGYSRSHQSISIAEVLLQRVPLHAAIYPYKHLPGLYVAPSSMLLVGLPQELPHLRNPNMVLLRAIEECEENFDYIIIDTPPSLNLLTINALCSANKIIVPMQMEYFAMEGLTDLIETISLLQTSINPSLQIGGIILNMVNSSTLCQEICSEIQHHFHDLVFQTSIPRTIKIPEAQSHALLLQLYAPHSEGSKAYNRLAEELISRYIPSNPKESPWRKAN